MPSPSPEIKPYVLSPHVADLVVVDGRVEYRDPAQRRRKVAICGGGGVRSMPWDDPAYECWAINNFWNYARDRHGRIAASRWWEQHQITPDASGPYARRVIQNENDMRWIRECPVPIYTTEPFPDNPRAVVWPIDVVAREFRDYFTCTFAMQIAQAIREGFEEIRVCGLELLMGTKREATVESSCVNYWLGLAEGRGIRIDLAERVEVGVLGQVHGNGDRRQFLLAHPFRYGHDYWNESEFVRAYVARWGSLPTAI